MACYGPNTAGQVSTRAQGLTLRRDRTAKYANRVVGHFMGLPAAHSTSPEPKQHEHSRVRSAINTQDSFTTGIVFMIQSQGDIFSEILCWGQTLFIPTKCESSETIRLDGYCAALSHQPKRRRLECWSTFHGVAGPNEIDAVAMASGGLIGWIAKKST